MNNIRLSSDSSEKEIGLVLDRIRNGDYKKSLLVEILSERHSIYDERPSYQMNRIKGYALASFAEAGLPDSAINFVLEELQNGRNAYMVAAAARGLRGIKRPGAQYITYLLQAMDNLRLHDDSLDLTEFKPTWPLNNPSSGKLEILRTIKWFRGYAKAALPELYAFLKNHKDFPPDIRSEIQATIDAVESDDRELDLSCCEVKSKNEAKSSWLWKGERTLRTIGHLKVQNEDGIVEPLEDTIANKPTVVAFFYTRCMNPNKCALTINKLGWLQKELIRLGIEDQVNILAFTYDPSYDTPSKMREFAENRGMSLSSNHHVLRTDPKQFSILSDFFQLGVNHVASTVNHHRLELFLLDHNGSIKTTHTRLQWEVEQVRDDLEKLIKQSTKRNWVSSFLNSSQQIGFPILLAFFPKCPVCWAVYLSAFGISSVQSIPYSPWLLPVIVLFMLLNLFMLYKKAKVRNGIAPFWISLIGAIIIGASYLLSNQSVAIPGVVLIFLGAILNSLSFKHWSRLRYLIESLFLKLRNASVINKMVFDSKQSRVSGSANE